MTRYAFPMCLFHSRLHAGLSRRTTRAVSKEGRSNLRLERNYEHFQPPVLSPAASANRLTTVTATNAAGLLTSGYGFVNTTGCASSQPRAVRLVARFRF